MRIQVFTGHRTYGFNMAQIFSHQNQGNRRNDQHGIQFKGRCMEGR